jgi:hypothetical protein
MDIKQYGKSSRLPLKTLHWMARKKIIADPLTNEDVIGLRLLEQVWWKSEILRAQLLKYSKKDRQILIETADLKTKWERYAHSRFKKLQAGEKLAMKQLIDEIEMTYDFVLKRSHIQRLYKVRQRVYNQRKKAKNAGK